MNQSQVQYIGDSYFPFDKDFNKYPKFRHNLWSTPEDSSETTYLTVSHSIFEVATSEASKFLSIRSHCTGHNSIEDIAKKSGVSTNEVISLINPLIEANILHLPIRPVSSLSSEEIRDTLFAACRIWSEQLAETYISNEIAQGKVQKTVVLGWLLESYHYIKAFPNAVEFAANKADGKLKEILYKYAQEEKGHEEFVAQSLVRAGVSRQEVECSIPLVSTRTIELLMRELFEFEPCSVLLVARVIEAAEFDEQQVEEFKKSAVENYGFEKETFTPFFEHVRIDAELEHSELMEKYADLLEINSRSNLHTLVNKIHDLKHAFDLQKLEIKEYYSHVGNYFPRQFVDFFAI